MKSLQDLIASNQFASDWTCKPDHWSNMVIDANRENALLADAKAWLIEVLGSSVNQFNSRPNNIKASARMLSYHSRKPLTIREIIVYLESLNRPNDPLFLLDEFDNLGFVHDLRNCSDDVDTFDTYLDIDKIKNLINIVW